MAAFLIFLPPPDRQGNASDVEAMRLVKDGFRPWAFLFGPVWFLAKRLWLGALLVVIAFVVVLGAVWFLRTTPTALGWISLLLMVLVGLEASTIERWTLRRRGWREADVVTAKNATEAEQKAAERLLASDPFAAKPTVPPQPLSRNQPGSTQSEAYSAPSGVIGLFPEPGGR